MEQINDQEKNIQIRPPVVVILGHVDHGKSSILEAIKDFKITTKESGGITQHIGAYEIEHSSVGASTELNRMSSEQEAKKITFIDTPGHEAFSAMRSRGAKIADIAVLVVAAEEGVKPQTKEAILAVEKQGISLIVAVNKIDKPEADPERVKRELAQNNVLVESMGGKIPCVHISAKTKQGILELLEMITLVADLNELKADLNKSGEGMVIESYLDSHRGPTATLILREGLLKKGDIIGTASVLGKIKVLEDFQGKNIENALPSQPVIVLGFEKSPQIGEKFKIYPDFESAQQYIEKKERKSKETEVLVVDSSQKVLNLILKADVAGSLEAIEKGLEILPQDKIVLRILKKEPGEINENDVKLAKSAKAKIIGFRVKKNAVASKLAEQEKIKIRTFDIIYELFQEVRQIMEKSLSTEIVRQDMGRLKVLVVFMSEKNRQIIGGKVIEGRIEKSLKIEVFRSEEKIGHGKIISLQKDKKNIEEAKKGEEIGILYEGDIKIELGDILVFWKEEREKNVL